jgi:hypothetical protein
VGIELWVIRGKKKLANDEDSLSTSMRCLLCHVDMTKQTPTLSDFDACLHIAQPVSWTLVFVACKKKSLVSLITI